VKSDDEHEEDPNNLGDSKLASHHEVFISKQEVNLKKN
jgi:hypothetical protein